VTEYLPLLSDNFLHHSSMTRGSASH